MIDAQILVAPAHSKGQKLHLDCFQPYVVGIIHMNAGRGTEMLNVAYDSTTTAQSYPDSWDGMRYRYFF